MSPYAPRKATLAESIYETIDEDENLLKISNDLLFNYSVKMFDAPVLEEKIDRQLALRYADLLSKSIHPEKADHGDKRLRSFLKYFIQMIQWLNTI